jgi:hypothetical protein
MLVVFKHYEPISYNWWLFAVGELIILFGCYLLWKDTKTNKN